MLTSNSDRIPTDGYGRSITATPSRKSASAATWSRRCRVCGGRARAIGRVISSQVNECVKRRDSSSRRFDFHFVLKRPISVDLVKRRQLRRQPSARASKHIALPSDASLLRNQQQTHLGPSPEASGRVEQVPQRVGHCDGQPILPRLNMWRHVEPIRRPEPDAAGIPFRVTSIVSLTCSQTSKNRCRRRNLLSGGMPVIGHRTAEVGPA